MKWLFSILLIANLGIFIWLYPQHRQADGALQAPAEKGDLRLVGESRAKLPDMAETPSDAADPVAPRALRTEKPTPPDMPIAAAAPAEVKSAVDETPAAQEEVVPEDAAKDEEQPRCETIGVFKKRAQAELLSVQLRALGLKPDIASETSNAQAGYWVLIPPQATRNQAIDIARELEAVGVEDLWRFTSGDLAHAISLGLFRDEERAMARRDQIASLGFNPVVRPRYREQTKYWLSYRYTGESPITAGKWQSFKQMFPELESEKSDCP
jgi:cell division protein FtsN